MEEKIILDRETYKKIKSMNRAEMEKTLKSLQDAPTKTEEIAKPSPKLKR